MSTFNDLQNLKELMDQAGAISTHPKKTPTVYLGYVYDEMSFCPAELVGVFATKSAAYRAVRRRVNELILDYWDLWACDSRERHSYCFAWHIKPVIPINS